VLVVGWWVVLGKVVCQVLTAFLPVYVELLLFDAIFERFTVLLAMLMAHSLSMTIIVAG
jgi:hypothetical protein